MEAPTEREIALTARVQALAFILLQVLEILGREGALLPYLDSMEDRIGNSEERPEGYPSALGWGDGHRARVQALSKSDALEVLMAAREALSR